MANRLCLWGLALYVAAGGSGEGHGRERIDHFLMPAEHDVASQPASQPSVYPIILGRLSIDVPTAKLRSAHLQGERLKRIWLKYDEYEVLLGAPETYPDKNHLARTQISGLPLEIASSEAETQRLIYTFQGGSDREERLSDETVSQLRQLHWLLTPRGILGSETVQGRGFKGLVNRFARGAEIQGWSKNEMTRFAVIIGAISKEDKTTLDPAIKCVLSSLRLTESDPMLEGGAPSLQDAVEDLNRLAGKQHPATRAASQPSDRPQPAEN